MTDGAGDASNASAAVFVKAEERRRLVTLTDALLMAEVEIDLYKASGTGGQKRNKTSSAVRMRHKPTGVISKAAESRSQADNRVKSMQRLRENLAFDLRARLGDDYQPSAAALAAVKNGPRGKNSKSRREPAYLLALAELLDVLEAEDAALGAAATRLGVTTGSLGKLLLGDDRTVRRVHEMRSQRGLKPLRG